MKEYDTTKERHDDYDSVFCQFHLFRIDCIYLYSSSHIPSCGSFPAKFLMKGSAPLRLIQERKNSRETERGKKGFLIVFGTRYQTPRGSCAESCAASASNTEPRSSTFYHVHTVYVVPALPYFI